MGEKYPARDPEAFLAEEKILIVLEGLRGMAGAVTATVHPVPLHV